MRCARAAQWFRITSSISLLDESCSRLDIYWCGCQEENAFDLSWLEPKSLPSARLDTRTLSHEKRVPTCPNLFIPQEEDVIGLLPASEKISSLQPLSDRVLIKVRASEGRRTQRCIPSSFSHVSTHTLLLVCTTLNKQHHILVSLSVETLHVACSRFQRMFSLLIMPQDLSSTDQHHCSKESVCDDTSMMMMVGCGLM